VYVCLHNCIAFLYWVSLKKEFYFIFFNHLEKAMDISVIHDITVSEHDKTKNEPEVLFPSGGCRDPFVSQFALHSWRNRDPQSPRPLDCDPGDCCGCGTGQGFVN